MLPAATLPVMLMAPVLLIETSPAPVCKTPVTVNGAAVFTREMTPAPLLLALKLVTVLALVNVVPVAETVVSSAPLIKPAPASSIAPSVAVRETLPLVLRLPAFNVTFSPATAEIAPDVLPTLALTRISLLVPVALKVTLPEPFAVTVLPSVSVPPVAVNEILPLDPVLIAPFVVNAPVFVTATSPVPVSLMPLTVKVVALLTREMPPPASVALKLVTALALPRLVPVAELVLSNAPLMLLVLISLIAPVVAVKETLPPVLMLPPFSVTLPLAVALISPNTALTFPLIRTLLLVPAVVAMVMVLLVPVVVTVPFTRISPLPTLPAREILPVACNAPLLSTSIAVLEMPLIPATFEPLTVRSPVTLTKPVPVTTTPPMPLLVSSAYKPKSASAVRWPVTIMLRSTEKFVILVSVNVPRVKSSPLPCRLILP